MTRPSDPVATPRRRRSDSIRVTLAWGILAVVAAAVALSYVSPAFQVCRDVTTATGTVVRACGPVGPDDLVGLGLVALLVFLLMPNLTEISFGSLVLKRRVADLEAQVARLTLNQQTAVSTTQIVAVNAGAALQAAEAKGAQLNLPTAIAAAPASSLAKPTISDERAQAEATMVRLWSELESVVSAVDTPAAEGADGGKGDAVARQWRELFGDELEVARAVRNTVAHRPENLTDEEVRQGVELAAWLLDTLAEMRARPR